MLYVKLVFNVRIPIQRAAARATKHTANKLLAAQRSNSDGFLEQTHLLNNLHNPESLKYALKFKISI